MNIKQWKIQGEWGKKDQIDISALLPVPGICQPKQRAFPEEANAGQCCICADISAAFLPFLSKITNKAPPGAVLFVGLWLDKSQNCWRSMGSCTGSWGRSECAFLPHWCVRWLQLLLRKVDLLPPVLGVREEGWEAAHTSSGEVKGHLHLV